MIKTQAADMIRQVNPDDNWTDLANESFGGYGIWVAISMILLSYLFLLALAFALGKIFSPEDLGTPERIAFFGLSIASILFYGWSLQIGLRVLVGGGWSLVVLLISAGFVLFYWLRVSVDSDERRVSRVFGGFIAIFTLLVVVDDWFKETAAGLGLSVVGLLVCVFAVVGGLSIYARR